MKGPMKNGQGQGRERDEYKQGTTIRRKMSHKKPLLCMLSKK